MIYDVLPDAVVSDGSLVYSVGADSVLLKDFSQYSLSEALLLGILLCLFISLLWNVWRG